MPIEIFIKKTNQSGGGTSLGPSEQTQTSNTVPTSNDRTKTSATQHALNVTVTQIVQQVITEGVTMYADISGNESLARKEAGFVAAGTDVAMIAGGGLAGVAVVLAKHAKKAIDSNIAVEKANFEINKQREVLGNISMKGSRY